MPIVHIPDANGTHSEFMVTSLTGLYGVPSIPDDVAPFRFDMQRKKTSSFAIVDEETLDPHGLFKKINIIDLIKNLERKAHVASVGIAMALQETFEFKFKEHKPTNPTYEAPLKLHCHDDVSAIQLYVGQVCRRVRNILQL